MNFVFIKGYRINLCTIFGYEPAGRNLNTSHEGNYIRFRLGGDSIWIQFENIKERNDVLDRLHKYTRTAAL